jgi:hypothetical protein
MIGGAGFLAGRGAARRQMQEQDEEARISTLESQPAASRPSGPDLTAQLAELAKLRDSGALDEAEFESAKRKVLG